MSKCQSMFYTGSVYSRTKDEKIVIYREGIYWVAESNHFRGARDTRYKIMKLIKKMGYTKFIGYTPLSNN